MDGLFVVVLIGRIRITSAGHSPFVSRFRGLVGMDDMILLSVMRIAGVIVDT